MSLSGLAALGKIAGIVGVSIGAAVLVLDRLLGVFKLVPPEARPGAFQLVAFVALGIGALGIIAWAITKGFGDLTVETQGEDSAGVITPGDVQIGSPGLSASRGPTSAGSTGALPRAARVATRGARSPGIIGGGTVQVNLSGERTGGGSARTAAIAGILSVAAIVILLVLAWLIFG
jgi:hypothetical protein